MSRNYAVHICSFEAVEIPRGRKLTYASFKAAALRAGRFSVFEATASDRSAALFDALCQDPEVVVTPLGFPWSKVELREEPPR